MVQQCARVGVRLLVDDRDEGNLEDGVGEIGIPGETGDVRPNARVDHRALVDVVPSVRDVQRLNRVDTTVVRDLVKGPVLASAESADPVDGPRLTVSRVGSSVR